MAGDPGSSLLAEAAARGRVLAVNMAADPALLAWAAAGAALHVQDERASALAWAAAHLGSAGPETGAARLRGTLFPGGEPPDLGIDPRLQRSAPGARTDPLPEGPVTACQPAAAAGATPAACPPDGDQGATGAASHTDPRLQGPTPDPQAATRIRREVPDACNHPRLHERRSGARIPRVSPDLRAAVAPECPFGAGADVALVNLHYLWGRQPLRDTIVAALAGLRPGGRLLLCGANDRGIRSAAADLASLAGSVPRVLAYRKGHRLIEAVRPHGWAPPPPAPPPRPADVRVAGCDLRLRPIPGIFAGGRLDPGTRLLVETMPPLGGSVLDLGCGSGAVGIAVAARGTRARIWATDDSLRAVRGAAANAAANDVADRFVFVHGDGFAALPPRLRFQAIAVNPPFHFGAVSTTVVAEAWLRQAPSRLVRGGRLYVVYNRFLPYLRVLGEAFGARRATLLADAGGYRVAGAVRAR